MTRVLTRMMLTGALLCLPTAIAFAQAQTSTTSQTKKFEVIAVDGNHLVVKLPEGTRELTVPDGFRFNVDGRELSVSELKPGMAGTATITTKTTVTPVTVTEVKNGTVMQNMGSSILVRTEQGMKMFSQGDIDKRGVKIMKDGRVVDLSELRANDQLTATIITSKPPRVMSEQQVQATLARSGGGASGAAGAPTAQASPPPPRTAPTSPAPGQTAPTSGEVPKKLPKTASQLPILGLAGLASLVIAVGLAARRRRATR